MQPAVHAAAVAGLTRLPRRIRFYLQVQSHELMPKAKKFLEKGDNALMHSVEILDGQDDDEASFCGELPSSGMHYSCYRLDMLPCKSAYLPLPVF